MNPAESLNAVLVGDHEPQTPEWYAVRREGITATDLPRILGLSKYGNAMSVWLDKRGELPDDPAGEAAAWGHLLEDVVATEWARRHDTQVRPIGVLAHPEHRWRRASLDRLVWTERGFTEALEVKTRSAWTSGQWREDMPDDVLAQVAWGRHVSGVDRIHVAVLIGGQQMKTFTYERDDDLEEFLVEQAQVVWDCVASGVPPTVEPDGEGLLLSLLNRLYGQREGDRDLSDRAGDVEPLLVDYKLAAAGEAAAKADKTRAKTALLQLLDDAETGVVDGERRFTYKRPAAGVTVSADGLRRLRRERPEAYEDLRAAGFITTTSPEPRFAVCKRAVTAEETVDA